MHAANIGCVTQVCKRRPDGDDTSSAITCRRFLLCGSERVVVSDQTSPPYTSTVSESGHWTHNGSVTNGMVVLSIVMMCCSARLEKPSEPAPYPHSTKTAGNEKRVVSLNQSRIISEEEDSTPPSY